METPATTPYYHSISWNSPPEKPLSELPPAPSGTDRIFVNSPGGRLELLRPYEEVQLSKPNLLFIHGAFGSAGGFANFLPILSKHGYNTFALSVRGHGHSYPVTYFRMVYLVGLSDLADDVIYAARHIKEITSNSNLILFGHSAGAGISQYILTHDLLSQYGINVIGMCTLGAIPNFGSLVMYRNWLKIDRWMMVRMFFRHFSHPRSPFSTTDLIRRCWFSEEAGEETIVEVEKGMSEYDSIRWAYDMLLERKKFVDTGKVVENLIRKPKAEVSANSKTEGEAAKATGSVQQKPKDDSGGEGEDEFNVDARILVMAGEKDPLLTVSLMERMYTAYTSSWRETAEKIIGERRSGISAAEQQVQFLEVKGSGHDLMRDVSWEKCCQAIKDWLESFHS